MKTQGKGILADTCVWIEFFRQRSGVGDTLESLIQENRVWVCGIVLFELLKGIRSEAERSKVALMQESLPYIEMSKPLWGRAGRIAADLKARGVTLPFSDILIASIAIEYNLSVFTLDKHFEQIPSVIIFKD